MTHAELLALWHAANAARAARPDVPLALATLVAVEGSSYRQPGARLLCDGDGRVLAGAISGGCLEGDVALHASTVCASGVAQLLRYDLREDLESIWGFGTACDGIAHIVLAPLGDAAWLHEAVDATASRAGGVLLTVTEAERCRVNVSVAANGVRALGESWFVREHAAHSEWAPQPAREAAALRMVTRTARPFLAGDGVTGALFAAPIQPAVHLIVAGASRGAEAFARVALAVGWQVTVVDHREAALAALLLPVGVHTQLLALSDISDAVRTGSLPVDRYTAVAVCTHQFTPDVAWIAAALSTEAPYIGVLGSRQRAARVLDELTTRGEASADHNAHRLYAPIGLDLGGESPEGIALAAVAEIEAVWNHRPGGSLRERLSPIHERTRVPDAPVA